MTIDTMPELRVLPRRPVGSDDVDTPQQVMEYLLSKTTVGRSYSVASIAVETLQNMERDGIGKLNAMSLIDSAGNLKLCTEIEIDSSSGLAEYFSQWEKTLRDREFAKASQSPGLLLNYCSSIVASHGVRKSLKCFYLIFDEKLKFKDYDFCDGLLARVDPFTDSVSFTMGVLTATAPLRTHLKFFEQLLDKFEIALCEVGRDASKLVGRFRQKLA